MPAGRRSEVAAADASSPQLPARRRRRLPREVRERQIIAAAVTVFAERGFHAASMDEIADLAEISKPMLYAYIGSKEDLFLACMRREAARLLEAVSVVETRPPAAAEEQLSEGLLAFFRFVGENRDSWLVLRRESNSQGGPFAAEWQKMRKAIVRTISGWLHQAGEAGGLQPRMLADVEPVAVACVGVCESLADWWADHPQEPAETMRNRAMNVAWMGLANLSTGRAWRAPAKDRSI